MHPADHPHCLSAGAAEEGDGTDPARAGRGHRLTARTGHRRPRGAAVPAGRGSRARAFGLLQLPVRGLYPPGRPRRRADGRAAAGRGGVEADDQRDRAAGNDPPGPGQQPAGSPRGGAVSAATTFPALPLRARDPTDPCPLQRTDAAALPTHRAARRPGHLDDGRRAGRTPVTSSGADWTAGAAGAAGFASIGELYHGIERGCAAWSTATGRGKSSSAHRTRRPRRGTAASPSACQSDTRHRAGLGRPGDPDDRRGGRGCPGELAGGALRPVPHHAGGLPGAEGGRPVLCPRPPGRGQPLCPGAAGSARRGRGDPAGRPRGPLHGSPHPGSVHRRGQRPVQRLLCRPAAAAVPGRPPGRASCSPAPFR